MILVRKKKEDYIKGGQKAITDTADLLEGGIKKIDDLENPVIDKATSKMKKRILGYTRPLKTIFNKKNKEFSSIALNDGTQPLQASNNETEGSGGGDFKENLKRTAKMTALCASGGVGVSLYAGKKLDQKKYVSFR